MSADEEVAFREIYDLYKNKVYYIAYNMLRSEIDAKDTLQDVFLKIWQNRTSLIEIEKFSSYLNVLVRNTIYDRFRKNMREYEYLQHLIPEHLAIEKDQLFNEIKYRQLLNQVYEVSRNLPPQQRRVFELSKIHGLTHDSIAIELGITKETVKKHLTAALKQIRQHLTFQRDI